MINADSAQIYADLGVVAASPSAAERARAPHQLYGVRDGALPCSAADWARMAKPEIAAAQAAGKLPILVGGTGLYLRTLLEGIAPIPEIDPEIRAVVRAASTLDNHAALQDEDPAAAARLSANDTTRVARALEIVRSTGRTQADWQAEKRGGIADDVTLAPLILVPPREWLADRCERRFAAMMDGGAVEEVEALLGRGLDPMLPVMRAIGVPEIAAFLRGETDREATIAAGALATRQYLKRQTTWFRNQPPADWPRFTEPLDGEAAVERALALLTSAL